MPSFLYYNNESDSSRYYKVVCTVVFICFCFCYLYFYQCDVLAAGQHVLSEGQTHYSRGIGAVLITLTLYLLQWLVAYVTQLKNRAYAMTYFPSLLILTVITDVSSEIDKGFSWGGWLIALPVVCLCFVGLVWALRQIQSFEPISPSTGLFSRTMWVNLLTLVIMFIAVGIFSNGHAAFHYRMRMESLLAEEQYEKALEIGKNSLETDASLSMLRAYALAKTGQLGNLFFHYPLPEQGNLLLPDSNQTRCVVYPDSLIEAFASSSKNRIDYKLIGWLLEKDLVRFSAVAERAYPDSMMPKSYSEALLLHDYLTGKPFAPDVDNILVTDFYDFRKMQSLYEQEERASQMRKTYGNTYWWYYKYGRKD